MILLGVGKGKLTDGLDVDVKILRKLLMFLTQQWRGGANYQVKGALEEKHWGY